MWDNKWNWKRTPGNTIFVPSQITFHIQMNKKVVIKFQLTQDPVLHFARSYPWFWSAAESACLVEDLIKLLKKTHHTLSIPYNKTKIQFFVWLYLTYFSRANKFGAVNAWSRPHSALILAFPAFSFSHFFSFRFFWAHAQSNRSAAHVLETILIYCGCTSYPDKVNTED